MRRRRCRIQRTAVIAIGTRIAICSNMQIVTTNLEIVTANLEIVTANRGRSVLSDLDLPGIR